MTNNIITEIFCLIDDFYKLFETEIKKHLLNSNKSITRIPSLSISEMVTILIMYSLSPCKNFKFYYLTYVKKEDFKNKLSYQRFVELIPRTLIVLACLIRSLFGEKTGKYFIDSTSIAVCNIKRKTSNKVFKNIAALGKTTKGWFFGFKLHLIINNKGEIMNITLTKGDQSDIGVVKQLIKGLFGKLYGDKGYISSKLFEECFSKGLQIITGIKKNMKNKLMSVYDKAMLRKRSLIETTFDYLKNKFNLEHTRHRSSTNFLVHIISTLIAYVLKPLKFRTIEPIF